MSYGRFVHEERTERDGMARRSAAQGTNLNAHFARVDRDYVKPLGVAAHYELQAVGRVLVLEVGGVTPSLGDVERDFNARWGQAWR